MRTRSHLPSRSSRVTGHLSVVALVLGIGLSVSACKRKDATSDPEPEDTALAQDGTDTNSAETDQEVLGSTLISASSGGTLSLASSDNLEISPADVGDGSKAFFFPRGCLTTAHDAIARTVTYDFSDCSGPNGLRRIRGRVVATYAVQANQLTLDLVGTGLRINRSVADWHATATVTAAGVSRTMTWKAELAGTTARGREFTRSNQKVVSWKLGERCFSVSGASEGDVRGRAIRTEISSFSRCAGSCPEAGGKITITNVTANKRVEIVFDGSARASFTDPKGQTMSIPLACAG